MTWVITQLEIQGVKGVLARAGEFDLPNGRSIGIYAPNGCGKSGYADALEYLFSTEGVVEHLGQGGEDSEGGGKHALPHVLARERGIAPSISVRLRNKDSGETIHVTREVKTGRLDQLPSALLALVQAAPAHRILRQHDLRRFVVDMQPREKYTELARWLGLEHLEEVLAHLTTTAKSLENTDTDRELAERITDLAKHTQGAVSTDNETATLAWCAAEVARLLGEPVTIASRDDLPGYIEKLRARRNEVVIRANKATPAFNAKLVLEQTMSEWIAEGGIVSNCRVALARLVTAERELERVRATAKESAFQEVWASSLALLQIRELRNCPVCETPWERTSVGTQPAAVTRLRASLEVLKELRDAVAEQKGAAEALSLSTRMLLEGLASLQAATKVLASTALHEEVTRLIQQVRGEDRPERSALEARADLREVVQRSDAIARELIPRLLPTIEIEQMPQPAKELEAGIDHIHALAGALLRIAELRRQSEECRRIERAFGAVHRVIQTRSQELLNSVLAALREDVKGIYRKIHPDVDIRNIHIELGSKLKSLILRVDFYAENRRVPPGGYLSEAQINSLGFSLFVAAVRLFNVTFPFVVLDDIVSSYDADNRMRIVDVIAEDLSGFQVFLTTHDERFYEALWRRLEDRGWRFDRITGWSFEEGPKRESDRGKPHQVEALIASGNVQAAGNAVRQYIEEWLDEMCAKYEAYTVHKRGSKEFDRTLFDFWGPLITRLQSLGGKWFANNVEGAECFERLRNHSLVNHYSHAQADPYSWGSIGDVRYVWEEFRKLERLFQCKVCGKTFRYDRRSNRLFCPCSADSGGAPSET